MTCGLHYFENNNPVAIQDLKNDIAFLRGKGAIVKLAYGGEEYGNIAANEQYSGVSSKSKINIYYTYYSTTPFSLGASRY